MQQTLKLPELELRAETVRNKPVMLQVGLDGAGWLSEVAGRTGHRPLEAATPVAAPTDATPGPSTHPAPTPPEQMMSDISAAD